MQQSVVAAARIERQEECQVNECGKCLDSHTGASLVQLSAAGGNLRVVHLTANQNGASLRGAPLLEFVVHDGQGRYDKAPNGKFLF